MSAAEREGEKGATRWVCVVDAEQERGLAYLRSPGKGNCIQRGRKKPLRLPERGGKGIRAALERVGSGAESADRRGRERGEKSAVSESSTWSATKEKTLPRTVES